VAPTWNYVVVHAHGELVVHDDPEWTERLVRRLTDHHESTVAEPWSVDDAPRPFVERMVRAIVGVELRLTRLEGKRKLSQNRPDEDVPAVVGALERRDPLSRLVAEAMRTDQS
jgi:transcriptional regulator